MKKNEKSGKIETKTNPNKHNHKHKPIIKMIEIKPEQMKKGKLYYIQNKSYGNCSGRQKGFFTGIVKECSVYFTNIQNFNRIQNGYGLGDGFRNKTTCKFYEPQLQTIIDRKNYQLYCMAMELFINEKTNTRIGTDIVNVSERIQNKNSYFVSNKTEE